MGLTLDAWTLFEGLIRCTIVRYGLAVEPHNLYRRRNKLVNAPALASDFAVLLGIALFIGSWWAAMWIGRWVAQRRLAHYLTTLTTDCFADWKAYSQPYHDRSHSFMLAGWLITVGLGGYWWVLVTHGGSSLACWASFIAMIAAMDTATALYEYTDWVHPRTKPGSSYYAWMGPLNGEW